MRDDALIRDVDEILKEMDSTSIVDSVTDADAVIRVWVNNPDDMGIEIRVGEDGAYYWDYDGDEEMEDFLEDVHSKIVNR